MAQGFDGPLPVAAADPADLDAVHAVAPAQPEVKSRAVMALIPTAAR